MRTPGCGHRVRRRCEPRTSLRVSRRTRTILPDHPPGGATHTRHGRKSRRDRSPRRVRAPTTLGRRNGARCPTAVGGVSLREERLVTHLSRVVGARRDGDEERATVGHLGLDLHARLGLVRHLDSDRRHGGEGGGVVAGGDAKSKIGVCRIGRLRSSQSWCSGSRFENGPRSSREGCVGTSVGGPNKTDQSPSEHTVLSGVVRRGEDRPSQPSIMHVGGAILSSLILVRRTSNVINATEGTHSATPRTRTTKLGRVVSPPTSCDTHCSLYSGSGAPPT